MNDFDVFPLKGLFKQDDELIFKIIYDTNEIHKKIKVKVSHFNEVVFTDVCELEFINSSSIYYLGKLRHKGGFSLVVEIDNRTMVTAFEIQDSWEIIPRYGFLSDFTPSAKGQNDYLETLLKLHINVVQYYDWMYQHNDLVAKEEPFIDLMGRELSQVVVKEKVNKCRVAGMKNMAYGAIYGASNAFFEAHKEWGFFNSNQEPIKFIDVFSIMNFTKDSPWRNHLINDYKKAIKQIGFDGIHMDTYGFPKVAKDFSGNVIRLDDHFAELINDVKSELLKEKIPSNLIFNNVGAWPINKTYNANQTALYIEIWDPISTYNSVMELIKYVHTLTREKQLIISAYLKPYYQKDSVEALSAHKLLSSVIYASGASHLIMGDSKKVLRTGYYCDNGELNESDFNEIRKHYDFNAMYGEILYDSNLVDVSLTHTKGDNVEYNFIGVDWSPIATPGKVLTIIKEKELQKVIHLINLSSSTSEDWNVNQPLQKLKSNIEIELLSLNEIENIYMCSPDFDDVFIPIKYKEESTERGTKVSFMVDKLEYWNMIVINEKQVKI